jgi:hypothetical protein
MVWVWYCVYKALGMFHFEVLISTYGIRFPLANMLQVMCTYIYITKFCKDKFIAIML